MSAARDGYQRGWPTEATSPGGHRNTSIDYDVTEFDGRAGTPGLHTVRSTVEAQTRASLLPPDLFKRFVNEAFWRDPEKVPEGLQVV
jgi:sulfotransferase